MISGRQCRAVRAWLGWSQVDLCQKANLYRQQLIAFEKGGGIDDDSRWRIAAIFVTEDVKFHKNGSISLEP